MQTQRATTDSQRNT